MATITDKFMILDDSGFPRTVKDSGNADPDSLVLTVDLTAANLNATGTLSVTGETTFSDDVTVNGDLQVAGDIISVSQSDIVTEDAFIDLRVNSQSLGSGGLTVQVDNTKAQIIDLKAQRAQFIASTALDGAILRVDGDWSNATGTSGKSSAELEITNNANFAAGDTIDISDGLRTVTFTAVAGAPANNQEFEIGVDASATAANLGGQLGLSKAQAGFEQLFNVSVLAETITLDHLVDSQKFSVTSLKLNQAFQAQLNNRSANGKVSEQKIRVANNPLAGAAIRIIIRDSAGANTITLDQGAQWTEGATAAQTAEAIYNAILANLAGTPASRYVVAKYDPSGPNPDEIYLESAVGGTAQNSMDLSFSNNTNELENLGGGTGAVTANFVNAAQFILELDVIALSGMKDFGENNGLFLVKDTPVYDGATNKTDIEMRKAIPAQVAFCQNQFEALGPFDPTGAEEGTFAVGIGLSVLAVSDGQLVDAAGVSLLKGKFCEAYATYPSADSSPAAGREYVEYESFGNVSLQEAYVVGNSITTDATNGDIDFIIGDTAAREFSVQTGTNNQGDIKFGDFAGNSLRNYTGAFANAVQVTGASQTLVADNGQFIIQGQDALANSIVITESSGAAGDANLIIGLGAGGTSGGLKLDDGTGEITIDAAAYSDNLMDTYAFAPATSFDVESAAVTIGTDNTAGSTFTVGESSQANDIAMDAGTGAFSIEADSASSINVDGSSLILNANADAAGASGSFVLSGDNSSNIQILGDALNTADQFLAIHAGHTNAGAFGIITIGESSLGAASSDMLGLSARKTVIGRVATPTTVADLYSDAYRRPMGLYMKAGVGIAVGQCLVLENDVAGGNAVILSDCDAVSDDDRKFVGIAMEAATAGDPVRMASVAGTIAFLKLDAAPAQADVGKPVYVSDTAGSGTMTAPTASGTTVFKIGMLVSEVADADLNYSVLIQPQFIAKRP